MIGVFSRPFFKFSSCESSTGHKAVKLNVDASTIWLSDMRWTLTLWCYPYQELLSRMVFVIAPNLGAVPTI